MSKPDINISTPATNWIATAPGVLVLPLTKFQITHTESPSPFHVTWDGRPIPYAYHGTLQDAKIMAMRHMAELQEMGVEV